MSDLPDAALIERFDRNGPRYTSYPTADRFVEAFDADAQAWWLADRARRAPERALSAYVHIPFCRSICYYCACNKVGTRDTGRGPRYVDTLLTEAEHYAARLVPGAQPLGQLHLGGGTPTFLDDESLARLLHGLESRLGFSADAELSIEVDPRTVDAGRLASLRALGFERLSFGVQDLEPAVQQAVRRVQSADQIAALMAAARALAFRSINIDLIYGLPLQTPASVARTIDAIAALRPDRIALYAYAHLPERFKPQRRIDEASLPRAAAKIEMMRGAIERLGAAGYVHIGMDHFALPDDSLARALRCGTLHRDFMGYTTRPDGDLIGLGVSSIGAIGPSYAQNERDLTSYCARVHAGELPIARGIELTPQDLLCRSLIMSIMCNGLVDFAAVEDAFLVDPRQVFRRELAELARLAEAGLLTLDDDGLRVTGKGRFFLRPIAMTFDRHLQRRPALDEDDALAPSPRFSRLL